MSSQETRRKQEANGSPKFTHAFSSSHRFFPFQVLTCNSLFLCFFGFFLFRCLLLRSYSQWILVLCLFCYLTNPQSKLTKPRVTQKELVVVRRSSRVAKQTAPVYAEVSHSCLILRTWIMDYSLLLLSLERDLCSQNPFFISSVFISV